MAWSTPMTAVAGTGLTAAQWNASVRDNLLETAPSKATGSFTTGAWFVTNGANAIAEREINQAEVTTSESDNMTSFADISAGTVGPSLTMTTGTNSLIFLQAQQSNSTANAAVFSSLAISGATTSAAIDNRAMITNAAASQPQRAGVSNLMSLTAGSNTFSMQYRVASNTGTWSRRRMSAMAL